MLTIFVRAQLVYLGPWQGYFGMRRDRRAVTAIEYALIAALIAVIIISALTSLGKGVSSTFNKVASEL